MAVENADALERLSTRATTAFEGQHRFAAAFVVLKGLTLGFLGVKPFFNRQEGHGRLMRLNSVVETHVCFPSASTAKSQSPQIRRPAFNKLSAPTRNPGWPSLMWAIKEALSSCTRLHCRTGHGYPGRADAIKLAQPYKRKKKKGKEEPGRKEGELMLQEKGEGGAGKKKTKTKKTKARPNAKAKGRTKTRTDTGKGKYKKRERERGGKIYIKKHEGKGKKDSRAKLGADTSPQS